MSLHSVTVADPGKGLGGPSPPYFWIKLRADGPKKIFWKTPPPPFYSRVWMTPPPPFPYLDPPW